MIAFIFARHYRHYYTLHYPTLHTTLPYTTLPYSTHYTTLHYTTLHYTTLHYTTLHYTTLHYTTQPYPTLPYPTLHYTALSVNRALIFLCEPRFSDPGYFLIHELQSSRFTYRIYPSKLSNFSAHVSRASENRSEKAANNLSAKHMQCHRQWPEPNRPQRCTSHGRTERCTCTKF